MGDSTQPVTLTPDQIKELQKKLSDLRHNVNNNLALVVASIELIKRKPEMIESLGENLSRQPDKIIQEIRFFSEYFDSVLNP